MALRHAILAALLEGEASGYELSKRFDVSVANFWTATPQQLYRELERMADDDVVAARVVEQQKRPNKRVFSITEAGHHELAGFTTETPRPSAVRDELLVMLQAVDIGDLEAVRGAIADRVQQGHAKLAIYDALRDRVLDGRDEEEFLETAERVGPYLTLMRGRAFEQENIAWGQTVLAILAKRAPITAASPSSR